MNLLKSLNKEQWTAAAAVLLGVVFVGSSLAGGISPGAEAPPAVSDAEYQRPPARSVDFVEEGFQRYWQGKDIFPRDSTTRLPIPHLKAPEPRDEELPAPLYRPAPSLEAYNRLQVKVKYPTLTTEGPAVAAAELPAAAELEALKKLEEPEAKARPDRRNEREREFFTVHLRSGAKFEGQLLNESAGDFLMREKAGQRMTFKKADVVKWDYNRTYDEEYRLRTARIGPGAREADERLKLAQGLVGLGMMKEARDELARAIEVKKDHLPSVLLLGQLAYEASDFEGALQAYTDGVAAGAPAADLHYEIGRCLRALAFPEGALTAFERAMEASPRHQNGKLALARAQLELDRARAALDTANDFFVKLGNTVDTTTAHKAEGSLVKGLAQLRMGVLDKAKADVAEALRLEPQNAEALNATGVLFALEGQNGPAGAKFVEAIKANPYLTEAWTNLASFLLQAGKWADAEAIAAAAAQRDPSSTEAVLAQALAQMAGGKREAPVTLDRAVQMDPRNAASRAVLGLVKLRAGADEEALAEFTAALRTDYAYLPAYSGAAAAYLRTARRLSLEALTTKDEARAEALRKEVQARRVNAETLLRTVKDFDASRPAAWVALGCAYAVINRPSEAQLALRSAVSLLQTNQKAVDPLIFYVLGYVEYYYAPLETDEARLDSAHREFSQAAKLKGTVTDAAAQRIIADCEQAVADIDDWKVTSIRFDERFDRDAGKVVGPNWIEADDKYGIAITLENTKERGGRAKFSGRQAIAQWGVTTLSRDFPGDNFHAMELTFYPEKHDNAEFGVSLFHSQQGESRIGVHVGIDKTGRAWVNPGQTERNMDRWDMSKAGWLQVKTPLPNPQEITLRLTRGEKNRQTVFNVWFWNGDKGEWTLAHRDLPGPGGGPKNHAWRVSVFGRAWDETDYAFTVDNIRVYERARR